MYLSPLTKQKFYRTSSCQEISNKKVHDYEV